MTTGADFAPPVKFLPVRGCRLVRLELRRQNDLHRHRPRLWRRARRSVGDQPGFTRLQGRELPIPAGPSSRALRSGNHTRRQLDCRYRRRNLGCKFRRLCRQRRLGRERHESCGLVHPRRRNGQLRERFSSDFHLQGTATGGGPRKRRQSRPSGRGVVGRRGSPHPALRNPSRRQSWRKARLGRLRGLAG